MNAKYWFSPLVIGQSYFELLNIISLDLTIQEINTGISLTTNEISAENSTVDNYQWIDCNDYSILTGENGQTFTAMYNGSYAVILTEGECSDTSECITIATIGLNESSTNSPIELFPNPTSSSFVITSSVDGTVSISSLDGRVLKEYEKISSNQYHINLSEASKGIYIVIIEKDNIKKQFRLILD